MHRGPQRPDLARLADGTLPPKRRPAVAQALEDSIELRAQLREQRTALLAVEPLRTDRAPASLRLRLARAARRRPPWRLAPSLAAAAAAVLVPLIVLAASGPAVPTVAQAAALGVLPPTASVQDPGEGHVTLPRLRAAGLPFPYWEDQFGWHAVGLRRDRIDGRRLTTVIYARRGERVAYTIADGPPLPLDRGAALIRRNGVTLHSLDARTVRVVTWLRREHTCVLSSARSLPREALLMLGSWRGGGAIPY